MSFETIVGGSFDDKDEPGTSSDDRDGAGTVEASVIN